MTKDIVLLGSTGSIGTQTLDVAERLGIGITALAAGHNVKQLSEQIHRYHPKAACIYDENMYSALKLLNADDDTRILCGMDGLCELAEMSCGTVVNAIVGMVGLKPTLAAIEAGQRVALANKETLVAGGKLVNEALARKKTSLIPIDSEHSAIFQCLMGNTENRISKILLTASGGPFCGYSYEQLKSVTKQQALKHPNWNMGGKITIDSATLMNKGLEFIEAMWLFGVKPEQIEILVHRQSIVHSGVEFEDGSVITQLGVADMRTPIQLALTYPERKSSPLKRLSLTDIGALTFEKPDMQTFKCLAAAIKAVELGQNCCCIVNSANEAAVSLFLKDKIQFVHIGEIVEQALRNVAKRNINTVSDVDITDRESREYVMSIYKSF